MDQARWQSRLAQLADQHGARELDQPILSVLPELRLGDETAAAQVTVRHLLTHTSGTQGDFFHDTGRGEDRPGTAFRTPPCQNPHERSDT